MADFNRMIKSAIGLIVAAFLAAAGYWSLQTAYSVQGAAPHSGKNPSAAIGIRPYGSAGISGLTAGRFVTCYVDAANTLTCWGQVKYMPNNGVEPLTPQSIPNVMMASAGGYHVCAILQDHTIQCWGDNPAVTGSIPAGNFIQLSSGMNHVCAIDSANEVHCWGNGNLDVPTNLTSVKFSAVSSGSEHACAIRQNSKVDCWGDNNANGKLTPPNDDFSAVEAGNQHTCGITAAGAIECWGDLTGTPPSGTGYTKIISGSSYSCAQNSASLLSCWGGQAFAVDTTRVYSAVSGGFLHPCGLRTKTGGYFLACWGNNQYGQAPRLGFSPDKAAPYYLPLGRVYGLNFAASGGATPLTLTVSSGNLPAGLTLNGLAISGIPTSLAVYSPTLTLTENFSNSSLPLELIPVSQAYTFSVQSPDSTTTITQVNPSSTTAGSSIQISVQVTKTPASTPVLAGSVEVQTDETGVSCQAIVQPNGTAQCYLTFATPGTRTITARYLGDDFYLPSQSGNQTATISPTVIPPAVTAGDQFGCTIDGNGQAACWGKNDSGQSTPQLPNVFNHISAGGATTCARSLNGHLVCWGWDGFGVATPPQSTYFQDVSVGAQHACGLRDDGMVVCWGNSEFSQLAVPAGVYQAVSAGDFHSCALSTSGDGICWGKTDNNRASVPAGVLKAISAGGVFSCGIRNDDTLVCWGGDGVVPAIQTPPVGTFTAVEAGRFHACALRSDGQVFCWGGNFNQQLGNTINGYGNFTAISAGADHTCGLRAADNSLECWGGNTYQQAPVLSLLPAVLPSLSVNTPWSGQVTAGGSRTGTYIYSWSGVPGMALDSNTGLISGSPTTAGIYNFPIDVQENGITPYLKIAQNYSVIVKSQVLVSALSFTPQISMVGVPVRIDVQVSETPNQNMGAEPSGNVEVKANDGQLCTLTLSAGQGSCEIFFLTPGTKTFEIKYPGDSLFLAGLVSVPTSVTISPYSQLEQVFTGENRTYVHLGNGKVVCVGLGCQPTQFEQEYTAFGVGDDLVCGLQINGNAACLQGSVKTIRAERFVQLDVGRAHACGVSSSGQLTCWGDSSSGQTAVPPGNYQEVSAGANHTCALNLAGMPICWGANTSGQATPVGGPYTAISAGGGHTCALDSAGTVTCWGANGAGQSTPLAGHFTMIRAGGEHTCAINAQGHSSCWGNNADGQAESPYGVFTTLDAYGNHNCALRAGPKLTCWGGNDNGEAPQIDVNLPLSTDIEALKYWEHFFIPTGGSKPFTGSLSQGTLPQGMSMSLSPAGVVLFGTPQVPQNNPLVFNWESSDVIPLVREIPLTLTVTGTDLRLEIQAAPPAQAGYQRPFYWDFVITNQVTLTLPGAELTVLLPEKLTGLSLTGLSGCTQVERTVTCPIAALAGGSNVTLRVEGSITAWVGEKVQIEGKVMPITKGWPEVAPSDNQAIHSVTVNGYFTFLPVIIR